MSMLGDKLAMDIGNSPAPQWGNYLPTNPLRHRNRSAKVPVPLSQVINSPPAKEGSSPARTRVSTLRIVGIGASAGGLEAFSSLLPSLPRTGRVAYVLVQHLDPTHRSLLSELLSRTTPLPVLEIAPETKAQAGHIYVIPPNCDLEIRRGVLQLSSRRKNAGPARSIDRFLESLAKDQGERAIGVILSGAGSDGAKGLKAIKDAGGITFAQDADSAKYDSMPCSAVATGAVDFVLPPEKIGAEIERLLSRPGNTRRRAAANARSRRGRVFASAVAGKAPRAEWPAAPEDLNLRKIFLLLRTRTGTDFSLYRPNTIRRRLSRRMGLAKVTGYEGYLRYLREHPGELEFLYQDLLINVTSFFRNPAVFESLKTRVFPRLLKNHTQGDTLRIWVPGCSTGQEPYSLAMAYSEFAERSSASVPVQIFATDLNGSVLDVARTGRYTRAQLGGLSAARIQKYFVKEPEGFRVAKPIRDMVIFAQQNILIDPPFTRVDLISCRNMLIYFEPALQQKIIPSFHYALKPSGFLVLGSSESIGLFTNLFSPVDKPGRIYAKQAATGWRRYERAPVPPPMRLSAAGAPTPRLAAPQPPLPADDACKEGDRYALAKYAPATVVVNEDGDVLQIRGDTRSFLSLPAGKATLQLAKMAREGLGLVLQRALYRARVENRKVTERSVRLEGRREVLDVEVVPLRGLKSRCFLVVFMRQPAPPRLPAVRARAGRQAAPPREFANLKREHQIAREQLENLREEHETSVEELQASNEEVQSANEELQSLNEELETSNEELESANEELTTLNEELATRNAELRESEQRLREQAELLELAPVLARSPKDRIIFWNRGAEKLYGFSRDEALGQTAHLFLGAQFSEPREKIQADLLRLGSWDGEVMHRRKDGRLIQVATQWVAHHDAQGRLRAVLEVNTDITARRQAERALRASEEFNQRILESSPDVITVLDLTGRIVFMNAGGQRQLGDPAPRLQLYWPSQWAELSRGEAEAAYRAALAGDTTRFSGSYPTAQGEQRWWDAVVRPILGVDGRPEKILCAARDVTDARREEQERTMRVRLTTLRAEVGLEVARQGELTAVLTRIAEILTRHGDATAVHLWTLEEGGGRLRASGGPSAAATARPAEELLLPGVLETSQPRVWLQVTDDPQLAAMDWVKHEDIKGAAAFSLGMHGRILGVLALFTRHALNQAVVREFELTADVIGQFIGRKQAESERQRLLQDAMDARNEALAASRAKDDFIAALSHELRTPLNPVLLLASEGADNHELPEKIREDFKMIRNNVSLEAKLIDDLLDLTRIVHGKLSLELRPVDAHAILRDALAIVSSSVEQKRIDLALEFGAARAEVNGDAVRLQQVFWNVLNNAVKFTPAGGRISLQTTNVDPRTIALSIADNGTGLPRVELERIFEPFTQGGNRAGGLGLGLAISRQLVEKHGGRIVAESDGPGQGAKFTVTLPLLPIEADSARLPVVRASHPVTPARISGRHAGGRTLLLIEDHAATRTTLEALLRRRNFQVTTAGTAAAARKIVEDGQEFDIVLSDLGLPDSDGYALWAALRRRLPRAVGVALSGYGMEHDVRRAHDAGFAGHLTKPVSIEALDRALAALVRESAAARD